MRVPTYDQAQVQEKGLPNIRVNDQASLESFGGGTALSAPLQAAGQAAKAASDVYQQEFDYANKVAVDDARTASEKLKQSTLFDPKTGALGTRGKDALGILDSYGTSFSKGLDDIEAGLANDAQKAQFRQIKAAQSNEVNAQMQGHIFKENQVIEEQSYKTGIATEKDSAVLNYKDDSLIDASIIKQEGLVRQRAARLGMDEATTNLIIRDEASKTYSGVINRMLNNNEDINASDYFHKIKPQLTAEDTVHLEKALEEGTLRGASQRSADEILKSSTTLGSAIEKVRDIQDPKLRDAVQDRVRGDFALKEQAKRDSIEQRYLAATNIIEETKSFDKIPPGMLAQMPLAERSALKNYARMAAEGRDVEANGEEYYQLRTMASVPQTQKKFLETNLMEYKGKVNSGELSKMIELQADMRKGTAGDKLDGFMSDHQIAVASMKNIGIKKEDSPEGLAFMRKLDQAAASKAKTLGRKLNDDELRSLGDEMSVQVVTSKGWLWNSRKYAYQLTDTDPVENVESKNIPVPERKQIESYLKSKGVKVTPDAVESFYTAMLKGHRNGS